MGNLPVYSTAFSLKKPVGYVRANLAAAVPACRHLPQIVVTGGGRGPSPHRLHYAPQSTPGLMRRTVVGGRRAGASDGTEHA